MTSDPLQKIVIVGGGTSGWVAAAMLAVQFENTACAIELIESDAIGTIGVGESTIPPFVRLIHNLGIDEQDFIRATGACYKLGIKFVDWHIRGETFFHPFGVIGKNIEDRDFYQCWNKSVSTGSGYPLMDFSPNAVMAAQGRFFPPQQFRHSAIGGANYAVHLDATRVAQYLRRFAEQKSVTRTEGTVVSARQDGRGFITSVELQSGQSIRGDFFIDCTGFRALLIGETLGSDFEDWSHYLPCDRAVVARCESHGKTVPYTTATARKSGWTWQIPLRDRVGNGYVYASDFCTDAEAKSTLLRSLPGPLASDIRVIPFTTGKRREIWKNNCLALGLSSGFIEPLESTAIHLIARGMDFFLRFFPDKHCSPALAKEYNRRVALDYEEVRDFIILHYCASQRKDTPFWRWCKTLPVPDSLQERIELFRARGIIREGVDELFRNASWQALFEGMGIHPTAHCPRVDGLDPQLLDHQLERARRAILSTVKGLPTHEDYLKREERANLKS